MKRKILSALLLLVCFLWLAFLSGGIPVTTEAEAAGGEAAAIPPEEALSEDMPSEEAPASELPSPTADPSSADLQDESPTDVGLSEIIPDLSSTYGDDGRRSIATTITSGSLLDNDTYYEIDPEALAVEDYRRPLPAEGYQILIIHTHTTEAYTPTAAEPYAWEEEYRTTDPEHSVVRVGEALAEALRGWGLNVLHDTALHDHPSYSGSYARSGEAIEDYLAAYPGIALVIDLHRDALGDDDVIYRTLADIDGLEAAQLMFVMGTDINLENPAWRDNLALALTLQKAVTARYPTLMRPTVLCASRYNQQLCPGGSLLLEVGTSGNTLEEALTGVLLFADRVGPLLASWVE